jgi:hypothetical protein
MSITTPTAEQLINLLPVAERVKSLPTCLICL